MDVEPEVIAEGPAEHREAGQPLSPAARGLVPGLFLALVAAFGVLAANNSWLLPSVHAEGARLMEAAAATAAGQPATAPIGSWSQPDLPVSTDGRPVLPDVMASIVRSRVRVHVAGLWILGGSAAVTLLAISWAVGGAATWIGALVACGLLAALPSTGLMVTTLSADLPLAALAAVLLGSMTYKPRWSPVHGALAGLGWALHPAGLGLPVAAVIFPWVVRPRLGRWVAPASLGALLAALAFVPLGAGLRDTFGRPEPLPSFGGLGDGLGALARELTVGLSPMVSGVGGVLVAAVLGLGVLWAAAAPVTQPAAIHLEAGGRTLVRVPPAQELLWAGRVLALAGIVGGLWAVATRAPELPGGLPWFGPLWVGLASLVGLRVGLSLDGESPAAAGWWRRAALPAVAGVWLLAAGFADVRALAAAREDGRYLTAARWVESDVVRWVDNESQGYATLYTNSPDLVALVSGRSSVQMPGAGEDLAEFARAFERRPGAVVLFDAGSGIQPADPDELAVVLDVDVARAGANGQVLLPR